MTGVYLVWIYLKGRVFWPEKTDIYTAFHTLQATAMAIRNHGIGRARNRAARERALVMAAGRVFAARGYEAATTRAIAAEAHCAEGLIHRYFGGKAGLLLSSIQFRISQEVVDMAKGLRKSATIDKELLQLVTFELDRMWAAQDLYKILIPRAFVDPTMGELLQRYGFAKKAIAIVDRLKDFEEANLSAQELEALAQFVEAVGFMFGFMRPVLFGANRYQAKDMALRMTQMIAGCLGKRP